MAKAIREFDGKEMLHKYFGRQAGDEGASPSVVLPFSSAPVNEKTDFVSLVKTYPWLESEVHVTVSACALCLWGDS